MAKKRKTCGTNEGNPARESWAHLARSPLPAQVANQSTGFASSCPLSDSTTFLKITCNISCEYALMTKN